MTPLAKASLVAVTTPPALIEIVAPPVGVELGFETVTRQKRGVPCESTVTRPFVFAFAYQSPDVSDLCVWSRRAALPAAPAAAVPLRTLGTVASKSASVASERMK